MGGQVGEQMGGKVGGEVAGDANKEEPVVTACRVSAVDGLPSIACGVRGL